MALDTAKKKEIIVGFSRSEKDTGSSEVQIAIFSKRISELTEHLKVNKKDHSSRLGLLRLVGKRKHLLKYLKRVKYERYAKVISELGIKDR